MPAGAYLPMETLCVGVYTEVTRRRRADGVGVIVKRLRDEARTDDRIAGLRHEYEILRRLEAIGAPHVPRPVEFSISESDVALVTTDMGGLSLAQLRRVPPLALPETLSVASQCARALMEIHGAHLIHLDITPNNIVYNPATGMAQLIDFGCAAQYARNASEDQAQDKFEGTLSYMAPEQTGRVQASADRRVDFYGLGATLYALVTGRPPVPPGPKTQMLHTLLNEAPLPPRILMLELPEALEQVILKLLNKDPSARYQSAYGLLCDLQRCSEALAQHGAVPLFTLAQDDRSEVPQWPSALFGRDAQAAGLVDAVLRPADGSPSVHCITGVAGVGKTALLAEARRRTSGVYWAQGAYQHAHKNVGLHGVAQALTLLTQQILAEAAPGSAAWRRRLQDALGTIGGSVTQLVPALEALVGAQPKLAELGPRESEHRLLTALRRLMAAVLQQQPLVLCLEDMHFADAGTLRWLSALMQSAPQEQALTILITYQPDLLTPENPLTLWLASDGLHGADVSLPALEVAEVTAWLASTLQTSTDHAAGLAAVVHRKTGGIPLAVRVLVQNLWHTDKIAFSVRSGVWQWDLNAVGRAQVSGNVAQYMVDRLATLSPTCQQLLGRAACVGTSFHANDLNIAARGMEASLASMGDAFEQGLLLGPDACGLCHFAHDCVREAAVLLLVPDARWAAHEALALHGLVHPPSNPDPTWTCVLADHIYAARHNPAGAVANDKAVAANLQAALAAYRSLNYAAAQSYVARGLYILGASADGGAYELGGAFMDLRLSSLMGQGDQAGAEDQARSDVERAAGILARCEALERQAYLYWRLGRVNESLATSQRQLELLGVAVPIHTTRWQLVVAFLRFVWAMRTTGQRMETLADKPPMTDPRQLRVWRPMRNMMLPAVIGHPRLLLWCCLQQAYLAARAGVEASSPAVFSPLMMMAVTRGEFGRAARWAKVMRCLAERCGDPERIAYVELFVYHQLDGLTTSPRIACERLAAAGAALLDHGDHGSAIWAYRSQATVMMTISLPESARTIQTMLASAAAVIHPQAQDQLKRLASFVRQLQGQESQAEVLFGASATQNAERKASHVSRLDLVNMALVCLIQRDNEKASALCEELDKLSFSTGSTELLVAWQCCVVCMACLQRGQNAQSPKMPRMFDRAYKRLKRLSGLPGFLMAGIVVLADAELAGLRDDFGAATRLYEQACDMLERSKVTSLYALCLEGTARFYARCELPMMSAAFLARSIASYDAFGAKDKVELLRQEFPDVGAQLGGAHHSALLALESETDAAATKAFGALLHASETFAGEHDVEALAKKITTVAGTVLSQARMVVVLAAPGHPLQIKADTAPVPSPLPALLLDPPLSAQTRVVNDFSPHANAQNEPASTERTVASFAVVPMVLRDEVLGAIYCESPRGHAFFASVVMQLELIAGQGAVALENAAVHNALKQQVAARTREAQAAQTALEALAQDDAEIQMAGGFAHEIRTAVASARFSLAAAYRIEHSDLAPVQEEATAALDRFAAAAQAWEVSRGRDMEALATIGIELTALQDSQKALEPLLHGVNEGINRAMAVTTQVQEYAEAGGLVAGYHQTLLAPLLDELLHGISTDLQARGATIEVDISAGLCLPMRQDHAFAILRNLLANARDAVCSKPSVPQSADRIILHAASAAARIVVRVVDTGVGMNEATKARVFQPFFTTKGPRGTGLGLGLSRKLARLYGGDLLFSSQEGAGATFTLTLPSRDA